MSSKAMTNSHDCAARAPWQWRLAARSARRLAPAAGERLPLPAGSEWVAEGWPEARVVVLEAPQQ